MAFNISSWWHRTRVQAAVQHSGRPVQIHRVTNPFHAVSILAGPACRRTADEYAGKRFLSREAPQLPLETCDRAKCRCRYAHHEDRRSGEDRRQRGDVWTPHLTTLANDRRARNGRRVTDH
jgi:hypothetical protein